MTARRILRLNRSPVVRLARAPGPLVRRVFERASGGGFAGTAEPGAASGAFSGSATATATLKGSGALGGAFAGVGALTARFAGSLVGAFSGVGDVTATLKGAGAMSGSFAGVGDVTATPLSVGGLAGSFAGVGEVSATLKGSGALAGDAAGSATASATLKGSGALAGDAAGSATASATLKGAGALAGDAAGSATASATLKGAGALAGDAAGSATATATLKGAGALAGSFAGAGVVAGSIADATPAGIPTANAINAWTTDITGSPVDLWADDIGAEDLEIDLSAPAAGTISGLAAPDFGFNQSLRSANTTTIDDVTSQTEHHWWLVFNQAAQGSTGNGAHYYEIRAFLADYAGWWAMGIQEDGTITCGANAGGSDIDLHSSASGYDDGANHVVHFWHDGSNLRMRVDDEAIVSSAAGAVRTLGDFLAAGMSWGGATLDDGSGGGGPFHVWTFGAQTTGEVSQMYAALASIYGVTTP